MNNLFENFDKLFLYIGLPAQILFTSRFIVQWLASEKQGKCVVPLSFWFLSLAGSIGLTVYGFARGEPILIIGQIMGIAIYMRNLMLISREKKVIPADIPISASTEEPVEIASRENEYVI